MVSSSNSRVVIVGGPARGPAGFEQRETPCGQVATWAWFDMRLTFHAMVTRLHSPRVPARPRNENCRKPRTDVFVCASIEGIFGLGLLAKSRLPLRPGWVQVLCEQTFRTLASLSCNLEADSRALTNRKEFFSPMNTKSETPKSSGSGSDESNNPPDSASLYRFSAVLVLRMAMSAPLGSGFWNTPKITRFVTDATACSDDVLILSSDKGALSDLVRLNRGALERTRTSTVLPTGT